MKLKIPPAVQFLIFAVLMYVVTKITGKHFYFEYQNSVVLLLFLIGTFIGFFAVVSFRNANTSIDPLTPSKASKLVTSGLYQYTRNPMYLGLLIVQIALFLAFGNYYNLAIVFLYIWYITTFQIIPEEEILTEKFGDEFIEYSKNVRRWL